MLQKMLYIAELQCEKDIPMSGLKNARNLKTSDS